jgi:hypothetical protein
LKWTFVGRAGCPGAGLIIPVLSARNSKLPVLPTHFPINVASGFAHPASMRQQSVITNPIIFKAFMITSPNFI